LNSTNFGEFGSKKKMADLVGVHPTSIGDAQAILEYNPGTVDAVLKPNTNGDSVTFAQALLVAKENRDRGKRSVTEANQHSNLKVRVQRADQDLADRASAGEITWEEAEAQVKENKEIYDRNIERRVSRVHELLNGLIELDFMTDNPDSQEREDTVKMLNKHDKARLDRALVRWEE
jgi:hypothetical protein